MAGFISSSTAFMDYSNPTIYIGGFREGTLRVKIDGKIGDETFTIANWRNINETDKYSAFRYTIEVKDAERQALWQKMSCESIIPVTYRLANIINGMTYYSEADASYVITMQNAQPIITASVAAENTANLTGDSRKLIKYYSNAKASFTAEGRMGAVIDESLYIIRNGVNSAYSTECTFENVESNEFIFSAEDSRGFPTVETLKPEMVEYIPLTNNIADNRPDALGNMTIACSGNYFNDTFGAVHNTITAKCRYTISGSAFTDNWVDMTINHYSNGTYYASADIVIENFNQNQSYIFETWVQDKLDTVTQTSDNIKSMPIFHWGENDFVFEVPVEFKGGASLGDTDVDGDLNVTGDLRLKGSGNYGNTLRFGDGDYCYIREETDDVLTIYSKQLNLKAREGVYVNDNKIPYMQNGSWTPYLTSGTVASYTAQKGTYSIVGNTDNEVTVSVGFYIKATCNSGYQNEGIVIRGLPFYPNFAVAGGGMCSGACVVGGFNFQCFVLETNGEITTRVQACNNTDVSNLSTSASGCRYPSGGGEITLSGTITFFEKSSG